MEREAITRGQSGQAAVEYVGLVALMAGALAALAILSPRPAHHMLSIVERAICAGLGSRCEIGGEGSLALEPCPVMRSASEADVGATVLSVRAGGGRSATVEALSDGSAVVTLEDRREIGAEAGVGARLSGSGQAAGGRAEAGAGVGFGAGRGYEFADLEAAARFLAELRREAGSLRGAVSLAAASCPLCEAVGIGSTELPSPDFTYREGTAEVRAKAEAGAGLAVAGAGADGDGAIGHRTDHRTGETTSYHRLSGAAAADLAAPVGPRGGVEAETVLEYTTAPDGTPLTLTIRSTRSAGGSAGRSIRATGGGGGSALRDSASQGDLVERAAALDLDERLDRKAAAGVIEALGSPASPPGLPDRLGLLEERLDEDGEHDVRFYRSSGRESEISGDASLGVKLGGDLVRRASRRTLTSAHTSPAGATLYLERTDCVG
jgi:hypothetical protein